MVIDLNKHSFRFPPTVRVSVDESGVHIKGGTGKCTWCKCTIDSVGIHGADPEANCPKAPDGNFHQLLLEQAPVHC